MWLVLDLVSYLLPNTELNNFCCSLKNECLWDRILAEGFIRGAHVLKVIKKFREIKQINKK